MKENGIGVSSSADLKTEEEVTGPPTNTVPPANIKNAYKQNEYKNKQSMTEIDKNELNAEPIQDDKNKGAEDEDFINQKKQDAEEQASGVHSDGGGANCPEGQIWNAETETCVPVEGAGSVDKDVSKGVKTKGRITEIVKNILLLLLVSFKHVRMFSSQTLVQKILAKKKIAANIKNSTNKTVFNCL